jgi:hypothetical protein
MKTAITAVRAAVAFDAMETAAETTAWVVGDLDSSISPSARAQRWAIAAIKAGLSIQEFVRALPSVMSLREVKEVGFVAHRAQITKLLQSYVAAVHKEIDMKSIVKLVDDYTAGWKNVSHKTLTATFDAIDALSLGAFLDASIAQRKAHDKYRADNAKARTFQQLKDGYTKDKNLGTPYDQALAALNEAYAK